MLELGAENDMFIGTKMFIPIIGQKECLLFKIGLEINWIKKTKPFHLTSCLKGL